MKLCSKCNYKIDLSTRVKTVRNECARMKCNKCGTVYEVESKRAVKIINLLSFFTIFYLIYYFMNFINVERKIRIISVFLLAIVFYFVWNIVMSYMLEYKIIINGYNQDKMTIEEIENICKTSQAKNIFDGLLVKNGFDKENIDLEIIIDSFEEFLHKKFDCYEDCIIYM